MTPTTIECLSNGSYILLTARLFCKLKNNCSGKWSRTEAPLCEPADCGPPFIPKHGSVAGDDYFLNSIIRFSCDPGYDLIGTDVAECTAEGKVSAKKIN